MIDRKSLMNAANGFIFVVGIVLSVFTVILMLKDYNYQTIVNVERTLSVDKTTIEMTVEVAGAVNNPGVYHSRKQLRVIDAIELAGGLSESVDSEYISRNINLARLVKDGEKIYLPFFKSNDYLKINSNLSRYNYNDNNKIIFRSDKININTADREELQEISGIGEVKSLEIINNRPFTSIDDLVKLKILSDNQLKKIEEKISL